MRGARILGVIGAVGAGGAFGVLASCSSFGVASSGGGSDGDGAPPASDGGAGAGDGVAPSGAGCALYPDAAFCDDFDGADEPWDLPSAVSGAMRDVVPDAFSAPHALRYRLEPVSTETTFSQSISVPAPAAGFARMRVGANVFVESEQKGVVMLSIHSGDGNLGAQIILDPDGSQIEETDIAGQQFPSHPSSSSIKLETWTRVEMTIENPAPSPPLLTLTLDGKEVLSRVPAASFRFSGDHVSLTIGCFYVAKTSGPWGMRFDDVALAYE